MKLSDIRTGAKFKYQGKSYVKLTSTVARNTRTKKTIELPPDTEITFN